MDIKIVQFIVVRRGGGPEIIMYRCCRSRKTYGRMTTDNGLYFTLHMFVSLRRQMEHCELFRRNEIKWKAPQTWINTLVFSRSFRFTFPSPKSASCTLVLLNTRFMLIHGHFQTISLSII